MLINEIYFVCLRVYLLAYLFVCLFYCIHHHSRQLRTIMERRRRRKYKYSKSHGFASEILVKFKKSLFKTMFVISSMLLPLASTVFCDTH